MPKYTKETVHRFTTKGMGKIWRNLTDYTGVKMPGYTDKLGPSLKTATVYNKKTSNSQSKGHYTKAMSQKGRTRYV